MRFSPVCDTCLRQIATATDIDGEVTRALFFVQGLSETGASIVDEFLAWTSLDAARDAVEMQPGPEGHLTQIGVLLDDERHRYSTQAQLIEALGPGAERVEVLTWDEAVPEMVTVLEFSRGFLFLFMIVVLIVVAFGITNSFLMAVVERVREFGLLSAMGVGPCFWLLWVCS